MRSFISAVSLLLLSLCAPAVPQVQDIYRINLGAFASHIEHREVELAPGKELVLGEFDGPGKVTYFSYTDSNVGSGFVYPGLILKVYWDDAIEPSIRVPLWSFFGAFGKTIDYQSLPMQINHLCYMSYLPMPFSKRARFVLLNDGDETYHSGETAWGIDSEKNPPSNMRPAVCMSPGTALIPSKTAYT